MACDSDQQTGARHTCGGRRRLRDMMYMAAMTASRWNPELQDFHDRLIKAGMSHKVAIVAVMRKLIVMLNALLRDHRTWTPEPPVRHPVRRPARSDSGRVAARRKRRPARAACG